ncbi:hypothetical protein LPJ73_000322 [Coemansia sp. RSA 2703]|nr:hypothetical protein LPJ73_000322 [Coemansia sp. RSA 2703]
MKKVTYKVYVVTICTYLFILIAYGIPTTVLHKTLTVEYVAELRVCRYGRVFTELSFSLVWVGWAVMLLVTFLARNINTSFKEYREMLAICLIASMAIAYQTVVHHVVRNYLIVRWTRVTSTMMEMTACQISLFILVGVPAYNCLFHKEDYKKRWYTKMRADGMTARYGFEPSQTSNDNHVNSNADNSNTNTSSTLLSSSAAKV